MRHLLVLVLVTLPVPARAADTCARLKAGTAVRSRPEADAIVGKTIGAVIGRVVGRGAWTQLEVERVSGPPDLRTVDSTVTVFVARDEALPARCPAGANAAELGAISDSLELRWRDGAKAGWTHTSSAAPAAAASRDRVEQKGEPYVCFDYKVATALAVHVCGACAKLRGVNLLGGPGAGAAQPRPCAD
jgi:hypothetical protein